MKLIHFKDIDFLPAIKALFKELKVPMNYVADEPTTAKEILKDTYKDNATFQLADDVYFVGMVDDAAFEGNKSLEVNQIKSDYDGVLVFGITLHQRSNNLLPTRSQLAEISRAFNREFYYTPVILVFKYNDEKADYLAFANTERLKYKQSWREGEKAGKVSLLRDINIEKPHRGHEDIIDQLRIPTTGTKAVDSFAKLYGYWQEVFSVNILNKKFYQELSNWYFWAIKHVTFPNKPTLELAHEKNVKLEDLIQEHNATNVIRLLTRLLFTWFIKEKKLIPEELFDLESLQKNILKEISPYHELGIFKQANQDSVYYRAILQNLFFASLNCPIESDGVDNRTRGFRGDGYGTHRGIDYLMRYKHFFKDPDAFLELMNQTVPFLNGGLFECLDDKYQNRYIDGFSDQMTKGEQLIVPDYIFFGVEEQVDLSKEYGVSNKGSKEAAVKGLINILKSYKFTITENTPIEEDVALDPELLGKVFENLLASYNPETKTTARKQTGSFYTPREIVNYMVDESLIAYLKNKILEDKSGAFREFGRDQFSFFGNEVKKGQSSLYEQSKGEFEGNEAKLDELLHNLVSYDPGNPFVDYPKANKAILEALDNCKILDPACGSGAFPMGVLQKMVHILQKLDPENILWKEVQKQKVKEETDEAFEIEDKKEREEKLIEINNAFDERVNDPDYARKLYLIENCVYGVDIQPIATQIAKLRFFISLVVDQKVVNDEVNFGIRPLPNLETKFVTANTLVGIDRPKEGQSLSIFDSATLKKHERELKKVRHKLFSARTKDTKLKYRQRDEELRNAIADELKLKGWQKDSAKKLASWDPYDQNASSTFFDPEWMFDISSGFDVVIGNPPYGAKFNSSEKLYFQNEYHFQDYQPESYLLFLEKGIFTLSDKGILSYIIPNTWLTNLKFKNIRKLVFTKNSIKNISHYHSAVFDAVVDTEVLVVQHGFNKSNKLVVNEYLTAKEINSSVHEQSKWSDKYEFPINVFLTPEEQQVVFKIEQGSQELQSLCKIVVGMKPYQKGKGNPKQDEMTVKNREFDSNYKIDNTYKPLLRGSDINKYQILWKSDRWIKYGPWLAEPRESANFDAPEKIVLRQTGDSLIAHLDTSQFVCMNNLHVITQTTPINLRYLLGLINSKMMNFYYQSLNPEVGEALAEVKKENVARLKIKMNPTYEKPIELLARVLLHISSLDKRLTTVLDSLVFELYFHEHMKEREIDVLEYVERDIDEVLKEREFDSYKDEEKDQIIEQLKATWTKPGNEVRDRIKLFAVRSPEILKPILES